MGVWYAWSYLFAGGSHQFGPFNDPAGVELVFHHQCLCEVGRRGGGGDGRGLNAMGSREGP